MRVLYLGSEVRKVTSGADQVNRRNIECLKRITSNRVDVVELPLPKSLVSKAWNAMNLYVGGFTTQKELEIERKLGQGLFTHVFVSQSIYGRACEKIKKKYPDVVIISFFHNIEEYFLRELIKVGGFRHYPRYFLGRLNERRCVRYSNEMIVLNQRDCDLLKSYYQKSAALILPVSLDDNFDEKQYNHSTHLPEEIVYLFVGVAFFANVEAVRWFVANVLPKVKGKLVVVGKGMDEALCDLKNDRVEVIGFVDDLSSFYYRADFVVEPIFSGGGMKTKTAEALMYGKTILGTSEAFEGYNFTSKIGAVCNSAQEYINAIENLSRKNVLTKFNRHSRELYLKEHSNFVVDSKLTNLLKINKMGN